MWDKLRLHAMAVLLWIAIRIAPPEMRGVIDTFLMMLKTMPAAMEGRTWGVLTIPWGLSERERIIAIGQREAGMEAMAAYRKSYEEAERATP